MCVCVCERERERESVAGLRERERERNLLWNGRKGIILGYLYACVMITDIIVKNGWINGLTL